MSFVPNLSLMSLFEIGAHRGGGKSKLNPKLKNKVYTIQNAMCVVDLVKTITSVEEITEFLFKLGQRKRQVLIVGTSEHIKQIVPEIASKFTIGEMPFINHRWLGGTLTNWSTIKKTLKTLEKLENIEKDEAFFKELARNEQLNVQNKQKKISKFFVGLKNMKSNRPGAVIVLDTAANAIAIKEAQAMKVPVISLASTSTKFLPNDLSKVVVCNTNSSNTVKLVLEQFVEAYNAGSASPFVKEEDKKELENKVN
jgi:small subunit ribosomal protein S2